MDELKIVSLKCPGCGAPLEVSDDMENFNCGYCGTALTALRRGGTITLRPLTDAIAKVQAGTDKTAAELAIRRFQDELDKLTETRQERNEQWDAYEDHITQNYLMQQDQRMGIGPMLLISGVTFVFAAMAANGNPIIGILFGLAVFVGLFLFRKHEDDKQIDDYNKLVDAGEAELKHDPAILDQQIRDLNAKIKAKKRIADANDSDEPAPAPDDPPIVPPTTNQETRRLHRRHRQPAR
jgi:ribosomal protein S27AE